MFQKSVLVLTSLILAASVQADTIRTRLTKENRFPEKLRPEIGTTFTFQDFEDDSEVWSLDTYIRLGLADGFALFATFPYLDTEDGTTMAEESGAGDIRVGLEWRMWEDIFRYPWVISHIELDTDTGDEDDGLGDGETSTTLGIGVGTVTRDVIHWAAEARYTLNDEVDDVASGAVSIGFAVSEEFMLLAEAEIRDEADDSETDSPVLVIGGFYYQITESLGLSAHAGSENSSERETFISSKVSFSF
jgi:hypothetical protein